MTYTPGSPPATNTNFGQAIAGAGDLDGDGLSDFVIGEPDYTNGQTQEGAIHVFHGPAGFAWSSEVREGNRAAASYGLWVAGAGDVNGDGYGDVTVTAPYWDNPTINEGAVFVHRGGPVIGQTSSGLTQGDASDRFGTSLDVGDVTGDGLDDLVVGAPGADRAYVSSGAVTWSGSVLWNKQGLAGSGFGTAVAIVGDVNGDGFEDVLVGAPAYSNGQSQEGRAELYHGGPSGPGSTPVWTYEPNQANTQLGKAVAAAGDVNGDGYPDVIIGAPGYDNGASTDAGAAYVFFGSASGLATSPSLNLLGTQASAGLGSALASANVNGDAYSDIAVSAPFYSNDQTREGVVFIHHGSASGPSATANKMREATSADAQFGFAIANAGDINRDGRSEFIVGAPRYGNGQTDEGRISLYFGSATGLTTASQHIESNLNGALYGSSVAGVGDINGDDRSDVSVGAPGQSGGLGAMYSYRGGPLNDIVLNFTDTPFSWMLGYGSTLSRGGDMNGDGFSDYSVGAPLANISGQTSQGLAIHRGGGGNGAVGDNVPLKVKQRRVSTTTLIAARGRSDSTTAFQATVLNARSPAGRTRVKLQVEAKSLGTAFDGSGLVTSSSWLDTGVGGTVLSLQITRPTGDRTHWRARLLYEPTRTPGPHQLTRSRWYYGGDPREPLGVHVRIP